MTYTTKEKQLIKLDSAISGQKLWKISNPNSKRLNPYPILFIPGHLGDTDQGRSFSSWMHNGNDHYQYFALDFDEDSTGLHGSKIIDQAVFTNDAIQKILSLYQTQGKKSSSVLQNSSTPSISILAHSLGGIVARTAVLLSTHPLSCPVDKILMLGSPNVRPPFSPDPSLDLLFDSVNKAWTGSFLPPSGPRSSIKCRNSLSSHLQRLHQLPPPTSTSSSSPSPSRGSLSSGVGVSAEWGCPICAPDISLISVTGGLLDMEVQPDLTLLYPLSPFPKNLTAYHETIEKNAGGGSRTGGGGGGMFGGGGGRGGFSLTRLILSPFSLISDLMFLPFRLPMIIANQLPSSLLKYLPSFSLSSSSSFLSSSSSSTPVSNQTATNTTSSSSDERVDVEFESLTTIPAPTTTTPSTSSSSDLTSPSITEQEQCSPSEQSTACSSSSSSSFSSSSSSSSSSSLSQDASLPRAQAQDPTQTQGGQYFLDVSPVHWNTHYQPYLLPRHLSLRTNQLDLFPSSSSSSPSSSPSSFPPSLPMDHLSLLWCFELVQTLTQGLKEMTPSVNHRDLLQSLLLNPESSSTSSTSSSSSSSSSSSVIFSQLEPTYLGDLQKDRVVDWTAVYPSLRSPSPSTSPLNSPLNSSLPDEQSRVIGGGGIGGVGVGGVGRGLSGLSSSVDFLSAIPPLQELLVRNESMRDWRASERRELDAILSRLKQFIIPIPSPSFLKQFVSSSSSSSVLNSALSTLSLCPLLFLSRRLHWIGLSFFSLSIFSLTSPLFSLLTGFTFLSSEFTLTSLSLLYSSSNWSSHFYLDILWPGFIYWSTSLLSLLGLWNQTQQQSSQQQSSQQQSSQQQSLSTRFSSYFMIRFVFPLFVLLCLHFIYLLLTSPISFIQFYEPILSCYFSYHIALLIRFVMIFLIQLIRYVCSLMYQSIRWIYRHTLWNKQMRMLFRKLKKYFKNMILSFFVFLANILSPLPASSTTSSKNEQVLMKLQTKHKQQLSQTIETTISFVFSMYRSTWAWRWISFGILSLSFLCSDRLPKNSMLFVFFSLLKSSLSSSSSSFDSDNLNNTSSLSLTSFLLSCIIVVTYCLLILLLIWAFFLPSLLKPIRFSSSSSTPSRSQLSILSLRFYRLSLLDNLFFLYLFLPILLYPSFFYSLKLLFAPTFSSSSSLSSSSSTPNFREFLLTILSSILPSSLFNPRLFIYSYPISPSIFELFDSDRINLALGLCFIVAHFSSLIQLISDSSEDQDKNESDSSSSSIASHTSTLTSSSSPPSSSSDVALHLPLSIQWLVDSIGPEIKKHVQQEEKGLLSHSLTPFGLSIFSSLLTHVPSSILTAVSSSSSSSSFSSSTSSSLGNEWTDRLKNLSSLSPPIGGCVHEDGGKLAIFESMDPTLCVEICPNVRLGPTFQVISCACWKDKSLPAQDTSLWCEWCRCKHCGGKNIPKDYFRNNPKGSDSYWSTGQSSSSTSSFFNTGGSGVSGVLREGMEDYSWDLLLCLSLTLGVGLYGPVFFVGDKIHRFASLVLTVGTLFYLRDVLVRFPRLLPKEEKK